MGNRIFKRIFWTSLILVIVIIGGTFIFYKLVGAGAFGPIPGKDDLKKIRNATATIVYSSDDQQIGRIFAENRTNVKYENLAQNLIDALVATEDARFFEHEGVDRRSLLRVLVKTIILGDESAGGGSTIAQQLAKNLYGRKSFGFLTLPVNKTKEIILAQRLEELYSKEEILELYLNTVPFSENVYGIGMASQRFFSKKPSELLTEESAVLVGMLKANTYYNPRLNPENSRFRRNVVLSQMERYGYITEEVEDSLQLLPLELNYRNAIEDAPAAYFVARVNSRAREILEEEGLDTLDLEMDGLRIYSTLNSVAQRKANYAVEKHMAKLQQLFNKHWGGKKPWASDPELFQELLTQSVSYKNLKARGLSGDSLTWYLNYKHPVSVYYPLEGDKVVEMSVIDSVSYYLNMLKAGFLALHPSDGAVLAWVGGYDYTRMPYDHVLAKRQAASTFKPFIYATALQQGVDPCEYIANERRLYEEYEGWAPRNYDGKYGGYYSMAGALKKSINVAAVQTIFKAGVDNVRNTARDLGVDSRLPDDPTIALGTGSVSLYEMVRAYAAFANGGKRVDPYIISRIETASGKVVYQHEGTVSDPVLDEDVIAILNELLQGVVNGGTGIKLRTVYGIRSDIAGKTGTAQNYSDGWFIGYNPEIVAGAWVGGSYPQIRFRSGTYGSGSAMALPIFGVFFKSMESDRTSVNLVNSKFPALDDDLAARLDCEDFREKNFMDNFKGLFDRKKGRRISGSADSGEEKQGFFRKLFGGKK